MNCGRSCRGRTIRKILLPWLQRYITNAHLVPEVYVDEKSVTAGGRAGTRYLPPQLTVTTSTVNSKAVTPAPQISIYRDIASESKYASLLYRTSSKRHTLVATHARSKAYYCTSHVRTARPLQQILITFFCVEKSSLLTQNRSVHISQQVKANIWLHNYFVVPFLSRDICYPKVSVRRAPALPKCWYLLLESP